VTPLLGLVKTSATEMDIYFYRDTTYNMFGSILFNKPPADVITTYTNEAVLTKEPENCKF
jgi:hypothetical protein